MTDLAPRRPVTAAPSTEYLRGELVAGRWPADELPRLLVEQVVVAAVVRHPAERCLLAAIVPPKVLRDDACRVTYEAALAADPDAPDPLAAVVAELRRRGVKRTALDLLTEGGEVSFLAAGWWPRAVSELARRAAEDRVREAVGAALASLAAGARPEHVAARLAERVAS